MEEWVGSVVVIVSFGFGGQQQVVSQSERFDGGDNKKICDSEFDGPMEMMKGNGQSNLECTRNGWQVGDNGVVAEAEDESEK